jgi:hypothetical protein
VALRWDAHKVGWVVAGATAAVVSLCSLHRAAKTCSAASVDAARARRRSWLHQSAETDEIASYTVNGHLALHRVHARKELLPAEGAAPDHGEPPKEASRRWD